jgi:membrane protein implicated in regulation of membrane protease activity
VSLRSAAVVWFGAAVWIAFTNIGVGWKVLFVAFASTGCLSYASCRRGRRDCSTFFRAFRRYVWRGR